MPTITDKSAGSRADVARDWHRSDIIAELNKRGYTMEKLAEEHGLKSGSVLSKALGNSAPVSEKRISDALGVPAHEIWPTRYYTDGRRKPQGRHAIESSRRARRLGAG